MALWGRGERLHVTISRLNVGVGLGGGGARPDHPPFLLAPTPLNVNEKEALSRNLRDACTSPGPLMPQRILVPPFLHSHDPSACLRHETVASSSPILASCLNLLFVT